VNAIVYLFALIIVPAFGEQALFIAPVQHGINDLPFAFEMPVTECGTKGCLPQTLFTSGIFPFFLFLCNRDGKQFGGSAAAWM
jgi:hypothetical protein